MERDDLQSLVHDDLHYFPEGLEQANAMIVSSTFRKQNHYKPRHLLGDFTLLPNKLNEVHKCSPLTPRALSAVLFFIDHPSKPEFGILGPDF